METTERASRRSHAKKNHSTNAHKAPATTGKKLTAES